MTLTGRQIRDARKLLEWSRVRFSQNTLLTQAMVAAVESSDGAAWLAAAEVRARLVALESRRLVASQQDKAAVPPRRVCFVTAEGRRRAGSPAIKF